MLGTFLGEIFRFLQNRRTLSAIMLPYLQRFPNLASTLRIDLARQAHSQTLSQNHKALKISSQIFQTYSKI